MALTDYTMFLPSFPAILFWLFAGCPRLAIQCVGPKIAKPIIYPSKYRSVNHKMNHNVVPFGNKLTSLGGGHIVGIHNGYT
jgi:hypothetical protein